MKKLSLLLLLSVFIFCGCSDDDDTKTYILSLPNYETHTLDMGDQENPDDSWSVSSEWVFDPINARLASSCSKNGIKEAAIEAICCGETSINSTWSGVTTG